LTTFETLGYNKDGVTFFPNDSKSALDIVLGRDERANENAKKILA
jgi:hypothetical protein